MLRGPLVFAFLSLAVSAHGIAGTRTAIAPQAPVATFRSGVDLVRVSAIVRDRRGRFVRDLSARDLEVIDSGQPRQLSDFRADAAGVSVALLFDISGSMEGGFPRAQEAVRHLLSWLEPGRDEAAIFAFDTDLAEIASFTTDLEALPRVLEGIDPFGATSLHDAIAGAAERVEPRVGRRRAVVVFTDGSDNASRLAPGEVAEMASAIGVPVYVFAIVPAIDNPAAAVGAPPSGSTLAGPLAALAGRTGGDLLVASTPAERSAVARRIVDELRHQYLIAFESSGRPGWHPLVVRARNKDLVVRARSGYFAGQSRPISQ